MKNVVPVDGFGVDRRAFGDCRHGIDLGAGRDLQFFADQVSQRPVHGGPAGKDDLRDICSLDAGLLHDAFRDGACDFCSL